MKEKPANKLNPRIKTVWRIKFAFFVTLIGLVLGAILLLLTSLLQLETVVPFIILGVVVVLAYIVCLAVVPPILYSRWRYEISGDYLDIQKSKTRAIVPFIRVQDTNTRQGLLLRGFKLADVTISTAANEHVIPGLAIETAEHLRDRAAELARLAREDV